MIRIIKSHGLKANDISNGGIRIELNGEIKTGCYQKILNELTSGGNAEVRRLYTGKLMEFFKLGYEARKSNEEIEFVGF